MFLNTTLTKLIPYETDAGAGYKNRSFRRSNDTYEADAQPLSNAAAKKTYGIESAGPLWRCYLPNPVYLTEGEFVGFSNKEGNFLITVARFWENHTELVLNTIKGGG